MATRELEPLSASAYELADATADLRGRTLSDRAGDPVGTIDDIWLDVELRQPRMLEVSHGGFLGVGRHRYLLPIEIVQAQDSRAVYLDRDREQVLDGPEFVGALVDPELYYVTVYTHYGVQPYWEQEPAHVGAGTFR